MKSPFDVPLTRDLELLASMLKYDAALMNVIFPVPTVKIALLPDLTLDETLPFTILIRSSALNP